MGEAVRGADDERVEGVAAVEAEVGGRAADWLCGRLVKYDGQLWCCAGERLAVFVDLVEVVECFVERGVGPIVDLVGGSVVEIRTPSSICWPSRRLSASVIWVRR